MAVWVEHTRGRRWRFVVGGRLRWRRSWSDSSGAIDVLWFGLSKRAGDLDQAFGYVGAASLWCYWTQRLLACGYVIRKADSSKTQRGLESSRGCFAMRTVLHDRVA